MKLISLPTTTENIENIYSGKPDEYSIYRSFMKSDEKSRYKTALNKINDQILDSEIF